MTQQEDAYTRLLAGYERFYQKYTAETNNEYRAANASGQSPKVMMISCSDSRVNPGIITHAKLGEIFHVANVANIVPPYKPEKYSHHSTSAAIEFAVSFLNVEHLIVLGHSNCGGIRALLDGLPAEKLNDEYSFIVPWVTILAEAVKHVDHLEEPERGRCCEEEGLKISLRNLYSFPWVRARVDAGTLQLHAWYFDVGSGVLSIYNPKDDTFKARRGHELET